MKARFFVFIAAALSCLFVSCRKDNLPTEPVTTADQATIQKLKTFYYGEVQASCLKKSVTPDQGMPDWKHTITSDGKYLVPITVNSQKLNGGYNSSKYLLLTETENHLTAQYVYQLNKKNMTSPATGGREIFQQLNDGYTGSLKAGNGTAIAIADIEQISSGSLKGNTMQYKIAQSSAKGSDTTIIANNLPQANCDANGGTLVEIEWWYQEYDNYGNVIYEEYVYSTFECWGTGSGGSGGGSTPPTPQMIAEAAVNAAANTFTSSSQLVNTKLEGDIEDAGYTYRTRLYKWIYAKYGIGMTAKAYSIDKGVQKKKRVGLKQPWTWHSLEHLSEGVEGFAVWPKDTNGEISIVTTDAILGTYNAMMNIYWMLTIKYTGPLFNNTKYDNRSSVMTFNVESTPLPGYE